MDASRLEYERKKRPLVNPYPPLIFIDTETTGLDPAIHEVWEVAWAAQDGPITCLRLPHDLRTADPAALEINGYHRRPSEYRTGAPNQITELTLKAALAGATLVGANPAFDAAFLSARWRARPWHHRLIDVEALALQEFGWERPRGLRDVADALRALGFSIAEPDHTATGDVTVTRECYLALRAFARERESARE